MRTKAEIRWKERIIIKDTVKSAFWTGTGNTVAMAERIGQGVTEAGGKVEYIPANEANVEDLVQENRLHSSVLMYGESRNGCV